MLDRKIRPRLSEDADSLPAPEVVAEEIIQTVGAALRQFATVAAEFVVDLDAELALGGTQR